MDVLLSRAFVFKEEFALPSKCALLGFLTPSELVCLLPGPVDHPVAGPREENGLCIHFHFQKVFTDMFDTMCCILGWEFHDKEDRL